VARRSFHEHVQRVSNKSYKSLGFVLRNSKSFKSIDVLKTLYSAIVRSRLEYTSTVWAPYYLYAKAGLERVHRRFLKYLFHKVEGHYPPRGRVTQAILFRLPAMQTKRCRREISLKINCWRSRLSGAIKKSLISWAPI
jgi:hypothetical protein